MNIELDEESFNRMREERQREVDNLSLELLSNTKTYKKYMAKKCPEEQMKRVEYANRFLKYKSRITTMFINLIDEYENDDEHSSDHVSNEIHSVFKEFVQKSIQHLEWTEYSNTDNSNVGEFDDDDVMFATTTASSRKKRTNMEDPYSFWGATIRKSSSGDLR
jgi:hypothetical protein